MGLTLKKLIKWTFIACVSAGGASIAFFFLFPFGPVIRERIALPAEEIPRCGARISITASKRNPDQMIVQVIGDDPPSPFKFIAAGVTLLDRPVTSSDLDLMIRNNDLAGVRTEKHFDRDVCTFVVSQTEVAKSYVTVVYNRVGWRSFWNLGVARRHYLIALSDVRRLQSPPAK